MRNLKKETQINNLRFLGVKITYLLGTVLAILVIGTVFLTVEATASGASLVNIERQQQKLIQENVDLKNQIVGITSLSQIKENAENLGFHKATNIIYVTEEETFARLP